LLVSFFSPVLGPGVGFALGAGWTTKVSIGAFLRSWRLGSEFVSSQRLDIDGMGRRLSEVLA
jgi:hypothetical protein